MSMHVKKGDTVVVLTGSSKGEKGKIIEVFPKAGRVKVENVNMAARHKKARSAQDQSGIISMEASMDSSNVQIVCPSCGKPTRAGHMMTESGKKVRQCKKCGASLDVKIEKTKKTKKDSKKKSDDKDESVKTEEKLDKKETKTKTTAKKTTAKKPADDAGDK